MKKIEIYLKEELIFSILVEDYDINLYANAFDIGYHIKDLEVKFSIPLNKGYRIVADI